MKAVICAIAKYEYNYIKEWVEYHLKLGFDKIVIYDNNDLDGERYDELLADYIKKGQVELRDVRGKRAMQRVVYNEFYHEGDFDWVAIIDIDEFISPNRTKYKNIKEFIEKNSDAEAIFLYWQTYGDSGKTFPTKSTKPISILKQYSIPSSRYCLIDNAFKRQNAWGKSIIKKGLTVNYLHEHFIIDPADIKYVDCFGREANPFLFYPDDNYIQQTYKECYIKHLYTKSLYEYIDCKVRRPAANSIGAMHFPSKYFKVNEINEEKRKYLESIGYKMEFVFKPDAYIIIELKNLNEYYKIKPYILNLASLCSCRLNICITEEVEAVHVIKNDLDNMFNETCIYFNSKQNVITEFFTVFSDMRKHVLDYTNTIVHINIPYNVDIDEYIATYIDPIFNENFIEQNFVKLFNTDKPLYVAKEAIQHIKKDDNTAKMLKEIFESINKSFSIEYIAMTGNFIAKTKDVLEWKNTYDLLKDKLNDDINLLVYFISCMFHNFCFTNK